MGKIFENQPFMLELNYEVLPSNIVDQRIDFKKPSGERGSFASLLDRINKINYYYSAPGEHLGESGDWYFRSVVIDVNGDEYPGEEVSTYIYQANL